MFPLTNHDYNEVAMRSLQFTHIYIYVCVYIYMAKKYEKNMQQ